jgi:hypothetical protein
MDMQIAYSSGYSQTSDAVSRGIVVGTVASEQQRRDIVAGHFFKDCKAGMCTNWTSYSSFKSNILKSPSFQRQKQQLSAFPTQLQALQAKLEACQEQNNLNGRLLELSIVSNRRLASFLSKLRDSSSLTYDAKGNTRSGTRSFGIKA